MVLAHEPMHALGLAHPHDTGGTSSIMNGVVKSGDYGDFNLNQGVFTVMTYNNGYFTGTPGSAPDDSRIYVMNQARWPLISVFCSPSTGPT